MPEIELRPCRPGDIDAVLAEEPGAAAFWSSVGYEPDPATERFANNLAGEEA